MQAGEGGMIRRHTEHPNPCGAHDGDVRNITSGPARLCSTGATNAGAPGLGGNAHV